MTATLRRVDTCTAQVDLTGTHSPCGDRATWIRIAQYDTRNLPTDEPATVVSVDTVCSVHACEEMEADSTDPVLVEATYKPLGV